MTHLVIHSFVNVGSPTTLSSPVWYLRFKLSYRDLAELVRELGASQHFRSFWGAWRTIAGYEAIHMIRKGQVYGSAPAARGGLLHCFILGLFSAVTV